MSHFDELVNEAIDRLKNDIAEDVQDAIFQLRDESLIVSDDEATAVKRQLEVAGYAA